GPGLLESVYQRVLAYELIKGGLSVEAQRSITILYDELLFGAVIPCLCMDPRRKRTDHEGSLSDALPMEKEPRAEGTVGTVDLKTYYNVATTLIFKDQVDAPRAWQSFWPLSSPNNLKPGIDPRSLTKYPP